MKQEKTAGQELREGWEWCVGQRDGNVFNRQRLNYEARYCVWPNQSLDGRKWRASKGKEIFPWEGASDARVPLVDLYVREDAAKLTTAWRRMGTQVCGVESGDAEFGNRLKGLLRWQKYTQMDEFADEVELFAQWGLERGAAVMKVYWAQERQMVYEGVDLEELQVLGMQEMEQAGAMGGVDDGEEIQSGSSAEPSLPHSKTVDPTVMTLLQLIQDPSSEMEAAGMLAAMMPERFNGASVKGMKALVRDLRTLGQGRVCVAKVVRDQPRVKALLLNEDVFLPPEATEVGDEVYERELITETTLRERVGTLGWDEAWAEEMLESQRGVMSLGVSGEWRVASSRSGGGGVKTQSRLFEVIHAYRRVVNGDGAPELRYTCFNVGVLGKFEHRGSNAKAQRGKGAKGEGSEFPAGSVAYDGPLGYEGVRGLSEVFVLWESDKHGRLVDEARGYGEMAGTAQGQIKTEWDSRVDRASMATHPPLAHPPGQEPERWGPGTRWPVRRRDEIGFIEPPKFDPGSKEVELTIGTFTDRQFGRARADGLVTTEAAALNQNLVDRFLQKLGRVDRTVLKLDQQFLPDEFYYRVVGTRNTKPIHTTREEIQGEFDVMVGYNVELMDPNTKKERLQLMEQALSMDVNGVVDRDAAIHEAFAMIDPGMGDRVLVPGEEASQREIEDEQTVFAKMSAGVPVDVKPGQAYQLRLQTLQGILQQSPPAQQKYLSDENFRKIVDWRMQQLGHQVEQRQNAVIGRLGGQSGFDQFSK